MNDNMNRDVTKKTVAVGLALVLVLVIFIPSVDSHFSISLAQKRNSVYDSKLRTEESTNTLPLETDNWWNDSWLYRKNITIDYTKVDTTLTNFPILFDNTSSDYIKAQADGDDFVFVDHTNTIKFHHEIESFNESGNNRLIAWVNVTNIDNDSDTVLYLYYGNSTCSPQQNISGTWDSGFIMVHHMDDNTTSSIADSTQNHYDGLKAGANAPNVTIGFIGNAQWFDGYTGYIDTVDYDFTEAISYSFWVNIHSTTSQHNFQQFLSKHSDQVFSCPFKNTDDRLSWILHINGSRKNKIYENQPQGYWCFVAFSYDNATANNNFNCYHNNTLYATDTYHGSIDTNNEVIHIGCGEGHNYRANATIDEVRISNVARNESWIKTSYYTTYSPSTFLSVGSEEAAPSGDTTPPEITNVDASPNSQVVGGYVNITCDVTDNVGVDEVWVNITYPDSSNHNETMLGGSYYYNTTYAQVGIYEYFIWANDTTGNTNNSAKYTFMIQDITSPEIIDNSPTIGYTGDSFTFNATITDYDNVSTAWVEYWYETEIHTNVSMNNVAGDYWEKTIVIDDTLDTLHYFITANDTLDNWNNTGVKDVTTYDNDNPGITNVQAVPSTQNIGGYVNISASVIDNIEVDEVYLYVEYPDSSIQNFSITANKSSDSTYYCNKTYHQVGIYTYHIWANDTSGNYNISANYTFEIINQPPYTPTNPFPEDNATNVPIYVILSWNCGDPDGDPVTYNVYFGDSSPPPKVVDNQTNTTYDPGMLNNNITYYWKIIAWDNHSAFTEGPLWEFTTEEEQNHPPYQPSNPYPANGSTEMPLNVVLNWTGGDPDGDPVTYNVYFGDSIPPPKVVDNQTNTTYDPGILTSNTTYYWQIVAWDNHSSFTKGPIWHFTTGQTNKPPYTPMIGGPSAGNAGVQYDYVTYTNDPDIDQVYYKWDWGDESYSAWMGPFDSGVPISASHAWSKGRYNISVKAKDVYGAESEWADPLVIIIEDDPPFVEITKPEKALYIRNRKILPRFFRKTLILGGIDVTVDAVDDFSGIDRVEFYIDNDLKSVDNSSPYIYTWTKITLFRHRHTIKIVAFDNAGNTACDKIIVRKFF